MGISAPAGKAFPGLGGICMPHTREYTKTYLFKAVHLSPGSLALQRDVYT